MARRSKMPRLWNPALLTMLAGASWAVPAATTPAFASVTASAPWPRVIGAVSLGVQPDDEEQPEEPQEGDNGEQPEPQPAPEPAPPAPTPAAPPPAPEPVVEEPPAPLPEPTSTIRPRERRVEPPTDALGRRITTGETTTLAFRNVTVERLVPFITETTGKVVIPQQEVMSRRITIINDREIPQSEALDLVFLALQQNGISVVETPRLILLRDIAEIVRQDVPVFSADESVLGRTDVGAIAEKIYRLEYSTAESMKETLEKSVPDYATIAIDPESNQIAIRGNIGLLQRMERLIDALDRPNAASLQTETFRLRFADASQVAENIKELFEESRGGAAQRQQQPQQFPFFGQQQQQQRGRTGTQAARPGQQQQQAAGATGPSANLRVTANTQQNSVTVLAEPAILDQIRRVVETVWDQPLAEEAVVPRIYDLLYSDPVKVKTLLEGLFGAPTAGQGAGASTQGVGRLAGQFSFQALPEAGRLVVISKSPDNLFVIDEIIRGLDQPQTAGLPEIVELKHASAEELAEQLNALLAQEGTLAQIRRSESGLTQNATSSSPFASAQSANGTTGAQDAAAGSTAEIISFWWQRARPPTDNQGTSNLVSKVRIVPVWRQNAVMIMAAAEYRQGVIELIRSLDKPGRQVLISAVVAEISAEDATALGLRWSSQTISPNLADNSISIGTSSSATENNFLGNLFDTSVLDVSADVNLLLQALNQKTKVNILSEPRIFTSDNQEAQFFDGQDIPFITDSQINTQGNLVQSFDYRAVGIQLSIRPRITVNRDVDLRVNLELSSIQPQQTLFGGFIVDRRQTSTQLIVRDGQTIVISGILRSEESNIKRKVPLLGDIPLLGLLFTSTDKAIRSTELVAFITPLVVDNETRLDEINQPYRRRLGELRDELGNEVNKKLNPEPMIIEPDPGPDTTPPMPDIEEAPPPATSNEMKPTA